MKRPDRFAQIVEKLEKTAAGFNNHGLVYPLDVVELLRRQHAAYVRMVKRMQREIEEGPDPEHPINRAHHLAYANLLATLARYRKGTR